MQLQYKPPLLIQQSTIPCGKQTAKNKSFKAIFECFCGEHFFACTKSVQNGRTYSCGCLQEPLTSEYPMTKGLSQHPICRIWSSMMSRVHNPNNHKYPIYGARGIRVCVRWMNIDNFIKDMYPTYDPSLSLDRIDNNGNYEPSNCRWTTKSVQARNKRLIQSNNKSGYRGVTWDKRNNKWRASIGVDGKAINLGRYITALEAAIAYDNYVIRHNLEHTINNVGV
jgi:hypothetical protein